MFALDESLKVLFLDIARQCRSVICNRVTPLQKVSKYALMETQVTHTTIDALQIITQPYLYHSEWAYERRRTVHKSHVQKRNL